MQNFSNLILQKSVAFISGNNFAAAVVGKIHSRVEAGFS